MTVGTNNQITWKYYPFLRKECVLDTCLAHFKILGKALFPGKFPEYLALLRRPDILIRGKVVCNQNHPFLAKYLLRAGLSKPLNGYRCANIVAQSYVHPCIDRLTRINLAQAGMIRQDLLRYRHPHIFYDSPFLNYGCS